MIMLADPRLHGLDPALFEVRGPVAGSPMEEAQFERPSDSPAFHLPLHVGRCPECRAVVECDDSCSLPDQHERPCPRHGGV